MAQPPPPAPARISVPPETTPPARITATLAAPAPHADSPVRRESPRAPAVEAEAHEGAPAPAVRRRKAIALSDPELVRHEGIVAHAEPRATQIAEEARRPQLSSANRVPEHSADQLRPARAEPAERTPLRAQPVEPRVEALRPAQESTPVVAPPIAPPSVAPAPQTGRHATQRFPALAEPESREAPSIHVTIGRLIVEAVAPAPAAAPPLPAPRAHGPRLSLDEYLRQRRTQA